MSHIELYKEKLFLRANPELRLDQQKACRIFELDFGLLQKIYSVVNTSLGLFC